MDTVLDMGSVAERPVLFKVPSSLSVVASRGEQWSQDSEGLGSDEERDQMGAN